MLRASKPELELAWAAGFYDEEREIPMTTYPAIEPDAYRWRKKGSLWIYDPTPKWLEEHRHEVDVEPLYGPTIIGKLRNQLVKSKAALEPFAKMGRAMYVSGHCGGASPEDWPDKWIITIAGGPDFHTPQQFGGVLTVADFRRCAETDEHGREYEPGMNPIDDAEFGVKP